MNALEDREAMTLDRITRRPPSSCSISRSRYRAPDNVPQLPDVPRPGVAPQRFHIVRRDRLDVLPKAEEIGPDRCFARTHRDFAVTAESAYR